jgi:O-antigen/teichoic acid export membrane protein
MKFKKDLLKVFSSNFINILIGVINGFLIPAFLSIDNYAYLKTFTLYMGYVGILHFGFIDGIYLKYGGKSETELDIGRLKGEHRFLIIFQLFVTLISLLLGVFLNDVYLIAFSIAIMPINMQTLFGYFYQALGDFNFYSKIILITPNILLFLNLMIIFVLKIDNVWPFIIANIGAYYIVFIGLEIYFFRKHKCISTIVDLSEIWSHFKIGCFILIGNLSSMFIYSADRWFVKFSLSNVDFAFYSFAISMMMLINTLINSIAMTFYPYLARGKDNENLETIKIYLLILGAFSAGGYFAFDFVINTFLVKYSISLNIIKVLFAGFPAIIVINALYINLYKVNKLEKTYVATVLKICIVAVILNIVALLINKSTIAVAISTTLAFYIWYFYSAKDFSMLKIYKKEVIFLLSSLTAYFISTNYLDWLFGLILYMLAILLIASTLYKNELLIIVKEILLKKRTAQ